MQTIPLIIDIPDPFMALVYRVLGIDRAVVADWSSTGFYESDASYVVYGRVVFAVAVDVPNDGGYIVIGVDDGAAITAIGEVAIDPSPDVAAIISAAVAALATEATAQAIMTALPPAGAGSAVYADTITDENDNPLDGVRVVLSLDAAGAQPRYDAFTAADGSFRVPVDAGVYYRWLELAGYTFAQGVQVEVIA